MGGHTNASFPRHVQYVHAIIQELCEHIYKLETAVKHLTNNVNYLTTKITNPTQISKDPDTNEKKAPKVPLLLSPTTSKDQPSYAKIVATPPQSQPSPSPSQPRTSSKSNHSSKPPPSPTSKLASNTKNNIISQNKINSNDKHKTPSKNNNFMKQDSLTSHTPPSSSWYSIKGEKIPNTNSSIYHNKNLIQTPTYTSTDANTPNVWIIHDNILQDINPDRLGKSYSFKASSIQANHPDSITKTTLQTLSDLHFEPKPDIINIQTGIHGIQTTDAFKTADTIIKSAETIHKHLPSTQIIINKVIPTRNKSTNIQGKIYNALLEQAAEKSNYITITNHTFFANKTNIRNTFLPTPRGTKILASILGRNIRNCLWSIVKPKK